jgi:hypothetical protein
MKRTATLAVLSREHHPALVLAKRVTLADPDQRRALCTELPALFAKEFEPHFAREEAGLLLRLAQAGNEALVARTLEEHRQLRGLAVAAGAGDEQALTAFGRMLHDHVRFEERELFAAAETTLDAEWLAAGAP